MLSAAKHLATQRARPFAALKVTRFGNVSERLWGRPYSVRPFSEPAMLVSLQVVLDNFWIAHLGLVWIEAGRASCPALA